MDQEDLGLRLNRGYQPHRRDRADLGDHVVLEDQQILEGR